MAYTDPIILQQPVGTNRQYSRQDPGKYILTTSTNDEPEYMEILRQFKPGATSRYTVKFTRYKNVAPLAGQPAPIDDVLSYYTVLSLPHRSFVKADVLAMADRMAWFWSDQTFVDKLLRGEN